MPEDYEAVYTHSGGATAVFTRRDGSLDAMARGLDSEQFWVFKNVKALLVRNDEGDLEEATRLMKAIGFQASVRRLVPALVPAGAGAALEEAPPFAVAAHEEAHAAHVHGPAPSYWPLLTGISAVLAVGGLIVVQSLPFVPAIGVVLTFICMIGWGLEPFEVEA